MASILLSKNAKKAHTEFIIAYRLSPIAIIEGNFILYGICYRRPGYRGDQSEKSI